MKAPYKFATPPESIQHRFHGYMGQMKDQIEAARMLARHLGRRPGYWRAFLLEDRHPACMDPQIPWCVHENEIWYAGVDLLAFIVRQRPETLRSCRDPELTKRVPYGAAAFLDIDVLDGCRPLVLLETFGQGSGWLTPDEARELAKALLQTADQCDQEQREDAVKKRLIGSPGYDT